jgi:hypothetical protein
MTEKFNGEFERTGTEEVTEDDNDLVKMAMKKMESEVNGM